MQTVHYDTEEILVGDEWTDAQAKALLEKVILKPKEGAASPTPPHWKTAVKLRLEEMGWSQSDLSRELAKVVETTPQAISYTLSKAKQSSLRPFIDDLLWPDRKLGWSEALKEQVRRELPEIAETLIKSAEWPLEIEESLPDYERLRSKQWRELREIFDELDDRHRAMLMIEARYLRGIALADAQRLAAEAELNVASTRSDLRGEKMLALRQAKMEAYRLGRPFKLGQLQPPVIMIMRRQLDAREARRAAHYEYYEATNADPVDSVRADAAREIFENASKELAVIDEYLKTLPPTLP